MKKLITMLLLGFSITTIAATNIVVPMYKTTDKGTGEFIGTVSFEQTPYGLLITPNLTNVTAGTHGFHIHEHATCDNTGNAAGGHLDPKKTEKHLGPYNDNGHLGDLPVLIVAADGKATIPVLAPRLKLKDITNHSLMIHAGSDNYSDIPAPLGGGGVRFACGIIAAK